MILLDMLSQGIKWVAKLKLAVFNPIRPGGGGGGGSEARMNKLTAANQKHLTL